METYSFRVALLLLFLLSCTTDSNSVKSRTLAKDLVGAAIYLQSLPRENIEASPRVKAYLEKHKVFVSLTTSPRRIDRLPSVLHSLDLQHVTAIIVNLPWSFGRDGSSYKIPQAVVDFPKVLINRIDEDLGPITKIIPGIKLARRQDKQAIVISIDDDIGYPPGMIGQFIKSLVHHENLVVSGSVLMPSRMGLDHKMWPNKHNIGIIEGYGAIGYKLDQIPPKAFALMLEMIRRQQKLEQDNSCFLSDDLVISYALAMQESLRFRRVANRYYALRQIVVYDYGLNDEALHRGGGLSQEIQYDAGMGDVNAIKYQRCYDFLTRYYGSRKVLSDAYGS